MIDEKRIADFFAELVSIDSPSLEECEMADTLKAKFAEIGVNFTEDHRSRPVQMRAICLHVSRAVLTVRRFSLPPTWTRWSPQKGKRLFSMMTEP